MLTFQERVLLAKHKQAASRGGEPLALEASKMDQEHPL